MRPLIGTLLILAAVPAVAEGFRCGTRLVLTGDPVSRLTRACGPPDQTIRARVAVGKRGADRETTVTQWIYSRRGKPDMIVSVRGGKVVKIQRA
jgi:hypothetical protein